MSALQAIESMAAKAADGSVPQYVVKMLSDFLEEYTESNVEAHSAPEVFASNVMTFLKSVQTALVNPYQFKPFHSAIREPFDYYKWGNEFIKPLVIFENSKFVGSEYAKSILDQVSKGENVVILSNHQTEVDPQVISILLEENGLSELAEKIIFIAGHKVTNDPVAVPFSMGRNLICIHSKKHIKNPPEDMPRKQAQNLDSMKEMNSLMSEGGKVFWVAPSGGRDRADDSGDFVIAKFDFKALDMFKLISMQSKKPTHFYPMAMYTHTLVPPPDSVSSTLGESRSGKRGAVSVALLAETDGIGGLKDKEFTEEIQIRVDQAYKELVDYHKSVK
eukprot:gene19310-25171_t